jgi:hypothetical protein
MSKTIHITKENQKLIVKIVPQNKWYFGLEFVFFLGMILTACILIVAFIIRVSAEESVMYFFLILFGILCFLAIKYFLNKSLHTEIIEVTNSQITIIQKHMSYSTSSSYMMKDYSLFTALEIYDKDANEWALLEEDSGQPEPYYDPYEGALVLHRPSETIKFAKGIMSWDAEAVKEMILAL